MTCTCPEDRVRDWTANRISWKTNVAAAAMEPAVDPSSTVARIYMADTTATMTNAGAKMPVSE